MKYITLLLLTSTISNAVCWNLQKFNIGANYYVSSAAVFRRRLFLTLPRSSCFNNITNPTLIELPWPGEGIARNIRTKTPSSSDLEKQQWGDCQRLQDAISVDVDTKRGRLWVLDRGNSDCHAKIVVYNLLFNREFASCSLKGLKSSQALSVLVIDPLGEKNGPRGYVGGLEGQLLVFSLKDMKWWKLSLSCDVSNALLPISTKFLTLSEDDAQLFISGDSGDELYVMDMKDIRESPGPLAVEAEDIAITTNVTLLGQKLGPSSGMTTDYKKRLIYYLKRDYAIVRWDTTKPLMAEHHKVLAQSYEHFPYISHMFKGPQGSIWGLINPTAPKECNVEEDKEEFMSEDIPKVKSRLVRVSKGN